MNELELTGRARSHIIDLEQPRCALHFAVVASLLAMRDAAAREGIDLYLISCTRVGIEVETGALHAPDGFDDLVAGKLRMNPRYAKPAKYRDKAESYRRRWPWLEIMD